MELRQRINTFWNIYYLDALGRLVFGLPPAIPDDESIVTSMWPSAMDNFITGRTDQSDSIDNLASLYRPDSIPGTSLENDTFTLFCKGVAVYNRAIRLATSVKEGREVPCDKILITIYAATRLSEHISLSRQSVTPPSADLGQKESLIFNLALGLTHAASICLLDIIADKNLAYGLRRHQVTRTVLSIADEVNAMKALPSAFWCPSPSAHKALAAELARLGNVGGGDGSVIAHLELDVLMNVMKFFQKPIIQKQ